MKRLSIALVVGLSALSGAIGCGSDDEESGSSGAGQAACKQYCAAYATAACETDDTTETCESWEGCADYSSTPAGACDDAIKALYDCRASQADICVQDTVCQAEGNTFLTACAG